MTQEGKQLLLKDLCARLPYKVCAVQYYSGFEDNFIIEGIIGEQIYAAYNLKISMTYPVEKIKPYLRPISSITEEEEREFNGLLPEVYDFTFRMDELLEIIQMQKEIPFHYIDWLNSHHFDYRGLIEKGLALEAPEGMYSV